MTPRTAIFGTACALLLLAHAAGAQQPPAPRAPPRPCPPVERQAEDQASRGLNVAGALNGMLNGFRYGQPGAAGWIQGGWQGLAVLRAARGPGTPACGG